MKRCWFGGGLLLLLLLAGLWTGSKMRKFCLELSANMTQAAELLEVDRDQAQHLTDLVRTRWESRRKFSAVLSDHGPMENIEEEFRLLTPEAEEEDFRETCLRLSSRLEALGLEQLLTWETLF